MSFVLEQPGNPEDYCFDDGFYYDVSTHARHHPSGHVMW